MNRSMIGRPRRTANFCASFSSINEAFAVVQKYLADNVFVYYPPVSRKCDSVDQSTDRTACVARTFRHPFRGLSCPWRLRILHWFGIILINSHASLISFYTVYSLCKSMHRTVSSVPIRFNTNTRIVTPLVYVCGEGTRLQYDLHTIIILTWGGYLRLAGRVGVQALLILYQHTNITLTH